MAISDPADAAARPSRPLQIVQIIADRPGLRRPDLAQALYLSERQVQSDLRRLRSDHFRVIAQVRVTRQHGYRLEITEVESVLGQVAPPPLPPHTHPAACVHLGDRYSPVPIGRWQAFDGCTGDLCVSCFKSLNQFEPWRSRGILKCWYIPEGEASAIYFVEVEPADEGDREDEN